MEVKYNYIAQQEKWTEQEAKENGIRWKHWADPTLDADEYVKSDDGYVLRVKRIWRTTNSSGYPSTIVRTVFGQYVQEYAKKFEVEENIKNSRQQNGMSGRWSKSRPTVLDRGFVDLLFSGANPEDACEKLFPNTDPVRKARMMLKRKSVIGYMSDKYEDELKKAGLTKDWLFKQMKFEAENLDNKGSERIEVLKYIGLLLDVKPEAEVKSLTQTRSLYLDDFGDIDKLEEKNEIGLVDG